MKGASRSKRAAFDGVLISVCSRRLIEATNEARRRFLLTQVGRTEPVLFESKRLEDYYEGYTANYTPVHVQSPIPLFGKILPVKILEAGEDFCFGSLI